MNNAATAGGWRAPLRRLWWLPLIVGLVVGQVVAATTGTSDADKTSAVVNTRSASSEPNERVDLINDLTSVEKVSSVVSTVAEDFDLSNDELREGLTVTRLEASTFVTMSLRTDQGDDDFRREVLQAFLAEVVDYLQPDSPTPAFADAQAAADAAIDAYYGAIEENAGLNPSDTLVRLQTRLVEAQVNRDERLRRALESFVPRATQRAAAFEKLRAEMERAVAHVDAMSEAQAEDSAGGIGNLELSFVSASGDEGLVSSPALRRGVAGGLAAALIVAGIILLVARRRSQA